MRGAVCENNLDKVRQAIYVNGKTRVNKTLKEYTNINKMRIVEKIK